MSELKLSGKDELHSWFGMSYASWLTIPRSFMQEMPDEWQGKMAQLLKEYNNTFDQTQVEVDEVIVIGRKEGKNCKIPEWVSKYRHSDRNKINSIKYQGNIND